MIQSRLKILVGAIIASLGLVVGCKSQNTSHDNAAMKEPAAPGVTVSTQRELYQHFDSEVESRELGEIVMRYLRDLDAVAFVRFASVYRQFNDAYDFFEELRPMLNESPKAPK